MLKASKTRKRIVAIVAGTAVFAGTLIAALHITEAPAYAARVTLRGIEDIVSTHSFKDNADNPKPFTIVEVVPTMNDASIGYLIGGEEPIADGRSIKDMPTTRERDRYINGMVQDASDPHDWIFEATEVYNPTIDPDNNPDNQRPNVTDSEGRKYDIAYDLNEHAFTWSTYNEPPQADDSVRTMDIRGSFVNTGDTSGPYIVGSDVIGMFKKVFGNGTDDDSASDPPVYAVGDSDNGAWGKTPTQLGFELYRQSVIFRPTDENYTGNYYFNLLLLTDDSVMPVSAEGSSNYPNEHYNWQYFAANKIENTDSFGAGDIVYAAPSGDNSELIYYGVVINDSGVLKLKRADGILVPLSDLEAGTEGPSASSGSPSRLSMSLAPGAMPTGSPTPSASPTGSPTASASPTASPTGTETPSAEGTPSADTTPTAEATPGTDPTASPESSTDPNPDPTPDVPSTDPTNPADPSDPADPTDPTASVKNNYGSDFYIYQGVRKNADTAVLGTKHAPIASGSTYDYYVVYEDNGTASNCYYIDASTITPNSNAPYGRKYGYSMILGDEYNEYNAQIDKGPYFMKTGDADEYVYNPGHYNTSATEFYKFITNYQFDIVDRFEYGGGFYNNEWFKKYVFDRTTQEEFDRLSIDVVTVKLEDLGDHIEGADLIYFAGGKYPDEAGKDISTENAVALYSKVINENFPVMMERSTYYSNCNSTNIKNLPMLASLLMQSTYKGVPSATEWDLIVNDDPSAPYTGDDILDGFVFSSYIPQDPSTLTLPDNAKDLSYVHGTVFVNDDCDWVKDESDPADIKLLFKENPEHKIVRSDFITKYTDAKLTGSSGINGFSEISAEFDNEKPIIETYGNWSDFNSEISKATCIRYILNANNNRYAVKTVLNILDLEPYETAQYDLNGFTYYKGDNQLNGINKVTRDNLEKEWIRDNLDFEGDLNKVGITQIGTKEFIGMNQDLNETYDMIYIGMDTTLMNTDVADGTKTNKTKYNRNNMDGLIYSHIGDKFNYYHAYYTMETVSGDYCASGNDITPDKKRELEEYINAGYSLILSDSFFKKDDSGNIVKDSSGHVSINDSTVDSSSNMYNFIQTVLKTNDEGRYIYFGKNVNYRSALEKTTAEYKSNREIFARYLNISKLTIEAIKVPQPYDYNSADKYLPPNYNGEYSLDFEVKLKNDAALDASGTSYDCKLYIDLDADGKFEEEEAMNNLLVNGGAEGLGSDNKYHLHVSDSSYTISRPLPDDYVGYISWKLVFVQNENQNSTSADGNHATVRSAISGCSAVQAKTGSKPTVNILQIVPSSNPNDNTFDLNSTQMQALYKEVQDFDVKVYKMSVEEFCKKNTVTDIVKNPWSISYFDNMCNYDMLVFGFKDCYDLRGASMQVTNSNGWGSTYRNTDDISHDLMLSIREYALSGRSILFTHDLSSMAYTANWSWGYYVDKYLRDLQGMDRYGWINEQNNSYSYRFDQPASVTVKSYVSKYDTPNLKGSTQGDTVGFTDACIMNGTTNSNAYGLTAQYETNRYNFGGNNKEVVTAINEGQITQYPFKITEGVGGAQRNGGKATSTFDVAYTHTQYYQLNLDTDSRDENGNDDVVVWYTISNSGESGNYDTSRDNSHAYHRAMHNDVRNSYYLFSKGNILYTGAGHTKVTDELEMKLFVNTLVASYNSGLHAPKVVFKENPWDSSANVTGIYMPYDVNMTQNEAADDEAGGFLDDKIKVNFKTLNNNFKETNKPLYVNYYIKSTAPADLNIGTDYYKKITPIAFKEADATGNLVDNGNPYELTNYKVYQVTFKVADLQGTVAGTVSISDQIKIYVQIGTDKSKLSSGTVSGVDATESLPGNELAVFTTKLFDLE